MLCKISNCLHKRSRRGSMNHANSWALFEICPCCSVQLKNFGCLNGFDLSHSIRNSGCKNYLGKPEPVPKFGKNRKIIIKPKIKKTLRKFIKINSDPSKVDRGIIY